ncbi:MAG: glycosyltransferase family 4 protein [Desulfobacterales bacterium]|nr:glycosyltransferase family 4 protein [Desulfobacterales bacterium]
MTNIALLTHLIFGFVLFLLSAGICRYLVRNPIILDIPNQRSSHDTPIPKSGGIAIVITFLAGVMAIYAIADVAVIKGYFFLGFASSALLIAVVSLVDDLVTTQFFFRLSSQALSAIAVMAFGIVISELSLPGVAKVQTGIIGYMITFLWIVGLTNAFNFMDGINGMAGGTTVIACLFFGYICYTHGSNFTYIFSYTISAGTLGFMLFNFPKAKLFMGDVGSAFLGFVFANMAIIAALYDHSHTSLFVMPLLLFHFIYDTLFTFVRRLIGGEYVFEAHRSHLYQLCNQFGCSHTQVSLYYWVVGIAQGIGAVWMVTIPDNRRLLVFVPYLVFQVLYSVIVIRKAKAKGLL